MRVARQQPAGVRLLLLEQLASAAALQQRVRLDGVVYIREVVQVNPYHFHLQRDRHGLHVIHTYICTYIYITM